MKDMLSTRRQGTVRFAAGLMWFSTLVWFFGQFAAQAAWRTPYSLATNFVSDLGATRCGDFPAGSSSYVCSPLHAVMNTSFVLWGALWMVGGILLAASARAPRALRTAYGLVALGGLGTMLIGFVPETVDFAVHSAAALVQTFALGAGLAVLGSRMLRGHHVAAGWATFIVAATSVVGIVATGIATAGAGALLGVGLGVWERISLWPIPLWLAAAGLYHAWHALVPADGSERGASATPAAGA